MVQTTRLITLAVVAAVAAAALVTVLQQALSGEESGPKRGLGGRLVAATDLSAGHRLVATDVARSPSWQATDDEVAALTRAVVGRPLANNLSKGQRLQDSDLAARGSGPALVGQIPSGFRAITVMLREAGPGVVLFPGATVDVLATIEVPGRTGSSRETVTRPIVEGVRVLAVHEDSSSRDVEGNERRSLPKKMTVTLLASPAQANQIELASSKGTIGLTLRPEGDSAPAGAAAATTEMLVGSELGQAHASGKPDATGSRSSSGQTSATTPQPTPQPTPVWEVTVVKGDDSVRHPFPAGNGQTQSRTSGAAGGPR